MKNVITTIFRTVVLNHPILMLLMIFTLFISLLFFSVFILAKNGSITISIDLKNKKIEMNITGQKS